MPENSPLLPWIRLASALMGHGLLSQPTRTIFPKVLLPKEKIISLSNIQSHNPFEKKGMEKMQGRKPQFQKIVQFCAPSSLFPLGIGPSVVSLGEGDPGRQREPRASLKPLCRKGRPAHHSQSIMASFSAHGFTPLKPYFVPGKNFIKVPH